MTGSTARRATSAGTCSGRSAKADGKRVGFEGVAMMKLSDGKIAEYREVANVGPAFVELGFAPERTAKILAKEGTHLRKQPEFRRHLA